MQPPLIVPHRRMSPERSSRAGAEGTLAFGSLFAPPCRRQLVTDSVPVEQRGQ